MTRGKDQGVERMNTDRNLMQKTEDKAKHATSDKQKQRYEAEHAKAQAGYEALDQKNHRWLDDPDMEKTLARKPPTDVGSGPTPPIPQ